MYKKKKENRLKEINNIIFTYIHTEHHHHHTICLIQDIFCSGNILVIIG